MRNISIIIPIYNEEDSILKLHEEIKSICEEEKYKYEIIIVDDGSSDKSSEVSKKLYPIKYIRFRKNFGQTAAIDAGIKHAIYNCIVTIDGDMQNDPNDIPRLFEYMEKNDLDIVSGWRKKRKDNLIKKIVSRVANLLRSIIIKDGIHDSGCTLKIYKKECFEHITLFGEMHRFIPAILKTKGFKIGEIVVNHRPRSAGKTKYNWKRSIKGFIDMVSIWFWNKYAARPLHLMGGMGIISLIFGFISGLYTLYLFMLGKSLSDTVFPLLTTFFILTGIQLFISGLIADMLSKNYYGSTKDTSYSIKEIVENKNADRKVKR